MLISRKEELERIRRDEETKAQRMAEIQRHREKRKEAETKQVVKVHLQLHIQLALPGANPKY